jgi:hypothetical protein
MKYKKYINKFRTMLVNFINSSDIKKTNKSRPRKITTDIYVKYILQVLVNGIAWDRLDIEEVNGKLLCTPNAIYKMSNAGRHLATLGSLQRSGSSLNNFDVCILSEC